MELKLTKDQWKSINHALMHLQANKIYLPNNEIFGGGWYFGGPIAEEIRKMKEEGK